jgi:hypothetical protein
MNTFCWGVTEFWGVRISNLAEVFIKTHMLKYFAITVLSHDKDWESEGELP